MDEKPTDAGRAERRAELQERELGKPQGRSLGGRQGLGRKSAAWYPYGRHGNKRSVPDKPDLREQDHDRSSSQVGNDEPGNQPADERAFSIPVAAKPRRCDPILADNLRAGNHRI